MFLRVICFPFSYPPIPPFFFSTGLWPLIRRYKWKHKCRSKLRWAWIYIWKVPRGQALRDLIQTYSTYMLPKQLIPQGTQSILPEVLGTDPTSDLSLEFSEMIPRSQLFKPADQDVLLCIWIHLSDNLVLTLISPAQLICQVWAM